MERPIFKWRLAKIVAKKLKGLCGTNQVVLCLNHIEKDMKDHFINNRPYIVENLGVMTSRVYVGPDIYNPGQKIKYIHGVLYPSRRLRHLFNMKKIRKAAKTEHWLDARLYVKR